MKSEKMTMRLRLRMRTSLVEAENDFFGLDFWSVRLTEESVVPLIELHLGNYIFTCPLSFPT